MRQIFKSGAVPDTPLASSATSIGHPTEESPATVPGAFWFYAATQAMVEVIEEAGLTPDDDVEQLKDAINQLITDAINNITIPGGVTLGTNNQHLPANLPSAPADVVATLRGLNVFLNALYDSVPTAGNTFNKLHQLILARLTQTQGDARYARLAGATFTGDVMGVTPADDDDSTKFATTEWVRDNAGGGGMGRLIYTAPAGGQAVTSGSTHAFTLTEELDNFDAIFVSAIPNQSINSTSIISAPFPVASIGTTIATGITIIRASGQSAAFYRTGNSELTLSATGATFRVYGITGHMNA